MRFDMEEKEASTAMAGVRGFVISADGKKMLVRQTNGSTAVADVGETIKPEMLSLAGMRVRIEPREEWAVIFDEVWRMEKEYFYDPNMHGLDWDAIYDRYRPLVDHVADAKT